MVDIKRINYLAKKSREDELTQAEIAEQKDLRQEYINSVKGSLSSQLDNTYIMKDGKKTKLKKKG